MEQEKKNIINFNISKGMAKAMLRDGLLNDNEFNNLIKKLEKTYNINENFNIAV